MHHKRFPGRAAVRACALVLTLAAMLAGQYGCSGCMRSGGDGGQTPTAPPGTQLTAEAQQQYAKARPQGNAQQRPAQQQQAPRQQQPAAPAGPGELTRSTYDQLAVGMPFERVIELVGPPGLAVSSTNSKSEMYRWTNEAGDSYMAKFENGKLVRKTKLNVAANEAAPAGGGKQITMQQYNQIKKGMGEDRVTKIIGIKPKLVAGNNYNVAYYRWTDSTGTNFTAKFVNKRLDSMTGLVGPAAAAEMPPPPPPPPGREQRSDVERLEEPPPAQPLRGSLTPEEIEAFIAARRPPRLEEQQAEAAPAAETPSTRPVQRISSFAPEQRAPQVTVVGSAREPDADDPYADRSYKPRAKLPHFAHSLRRGVYEIRFVNDSASSVRAGLRAGDRGRDVTVAAGQSASVYVDRGRYDLHYLYKDDPYTLYSGSSLAIDGQDQADVEVRLENGEYVVSQLHEIFTPNTDPG